MINDDTTEYIQCTYVHIHLHVCVLYVVHTVHVDVAFIHTEANR